MDKGHGAEVLPHVWTIRSELDRKVCRQCFWRQQPCCSTEVRPGVGASSVRGANFPGSARAAVAANYRLNRRRSSSRNFDTKLHSDRNCSAILTWANRLERSEARCSAAWFASVGQPEPPKANVLIGAIQ